MFWRIFKSHNINSDFAPATKVSSQRGKAPYICGLRARIEYEPLSEYSTRSDRVTDIGCLSSLGASPLPFGKSEVTEIMVLSNIYLHYPEEALQSSFLHSLGVLQLLLLHIMPLLKKYL